MKQILDRFYTEFDSDFLKTDPVLFPHRYPRKDDCETVAFVSALFAYGSVALIVRNLEGIFGKLGSHPAEFLRRTEIKPFVRDNFRNWKYRFHKPADLEVLFLVLQQVLREYGSLNPCFLATRGKDFKSSMNNFMKTFQERANAPSQGVKFFFPNPEGKGTCKRLNLFFRWMVRRDSIDLGIWEGVLPSELYFPVDTHIHRIARDLGITNSKHPTWKTVEEITAYFRQLDPNDPVKYDFALTRLGMLRECPLKGVGTVATIPYKGCPLKPYCSKRNIACR